MKHSRALAGWALIAGLLAQGCGELPAPFRLG